MPSIANYRGIIPAIACPFTADHRIDEPALRKLASWLAGHDGVVAVMTNGHTGEVFSLTPAERADGHAHRRRRARRAGCRSSRRSCARASPTPPSTRARPAKPARWRSTSCRRTTGCASASRPRHALQYFDAIHRAAPGLDLVCHVYPAWTRASYSSQLLADLARLPYVQAFKVGQRDMNKYARDIQAIREADAIEVDPDLPRRVPAGVDGAGRRRRARRLRDVHSAAHHRPVERREGRRPEEGDGGAGDHHAAQGRGLRRRRAHRRSARAHEGRHVPRRRARATAPCARRPSAPDAREMDALRAAVAQAGLLAR